MERLIRGKHKGKIKIQARKFGSCAEGAREGCPSNYRKICWVQSKLAAQTVGRETARSLNYGADKLETS